MSQRLVEAAKAKGMVLATAESCTGGLVAAAITDIAGSSAMFDCGFTTYSNAAKIAMLGVSSATLAQFGAVSEQVAAEMTRGALTHSAADIAVAITGIAGPGGSAHKAEGHVCFGIGDQQSIHTETILFGPLGRAEVRKAAVAHALTLLQKCVDSKLSKN